MLRLIIKIFGFILIMLSIFFNKDIFAQNRFQGELTFQVKGINQNSETIVEVTPKANKTRWKGRTKSERPWLPTTVFGTVHSDTSAPPYGGWEDVIVFDSPQDESQSDSSCIPYGIYTISIINVYHEQDVEFDLDLRCADWNMGYDITDTHIGMLYAGGQVYYRWYNEFRSDSGLIDLNEPYSNNIWDWYMQTQDKDSLFVPVTVGNDFSGGKFIVDTDTSVYSPNQTYNWGWTSSKTLKYLSPQDVWGYRYTFDQWSDASDSLYRIVYIDDETDSLSYIAQFTKILPAPGGFDAGASAGRPSYARVWWTANEGDSIGGYYIQRKYDNGSFNSLTTIRTTSTSSFIDDEIFYDPNEDPVCYRMRTFDIKDPADSSDWTLVESIKGTWARGGKGGESRSNEENKKIGARSFELAPNVPNPFNPTTTIGYSLASESQVKLTIYNLLGKRVRILVDGRKSRGAYSVIWDSRDAHGRVLPAGIYIYRIEAVPISGEDRKPFVSSRKLLLAK